MLCVSSRPVFRSFGGESFANYMGVLVTSSHHALVFSVPEDEDVNHEPRVWSLLCDEDASGVSFADDGAVVVIISPHGWSV